MNRLPAGAGLLAGTEREPPCAPAVKLTITARHTTAITITCIVR